MLVLSTTLGLAASYVSADDHDKLKNSPPDGSAIAGAPGCASACPADVNGAMDPIRALRYG